jgi:AcrR family transcriptional regulator
MQNNWSSGFLRDESARMVRRTTRRARQRTEPAKSATDPDCEGIFMFEQIESRFSQNGRTPKGQRALRAVFRATRSLIAEKGLRETTLDSIAGKSGLTQAALRHYFPTRDDLLQAFFITASEWFRAEVEAILAGDHRPARKKLEQCIAWHLEYMENVETTFWLEASAYWLRREPPRRVRDTFYVWLTGQYAGLIGQIRPSTSGAERDRRAYLMLTLVLGSWITHGRGSAFTTKANVIEQRKLLIDAVMEIATSAEQ